jgi:hypothetical protein
VGGDLLGRVGAGEPSAQLHVLGDCLGVIEPVGKPSLLYLEVCGFMPFGAVQRTGAVGFTEFNAVVHRSDYPAGFYPDRVTRRQLADHRSYNLSGCSHCFLPHRGVVRQRFRGWPAAPLSWAFGHGGRLEARSGIMRFAVTHSRVL